jgi:hypothetical protein
VDDRSDDASRLLGLAGLAVEGVVITSAGVTIVQLVTEDPDAARCPVCRQVSTSGKDWVLTRPRDLPCGGQFVSMLWRKRRWRCRTECCPRQTFTEQVDQVPAGMRTTTRLRTALAVAVEDGRDQVEVAASYRVSWPTVQRAVVAYGALELVEPEPVRVLGMDETRFGRPRWLPDGCHADGRVRWVRTDPWETGFVDISGDQTLLGQVDGRTSTAVAAWLAARSEAFRAGIEVVVIDPHAGPRLAGSPVPRRGGARCRPWCGAPSRSGSGWVRPRRRGPLRSPPGTREASPAVAPDAHTPAPPRCARPGPPASRPARPGPERPKTGPPSAGRPVAAAPPPGHTNPRNGATADRRPPTSNPPAHHGRTTPPGR